MKGLDLLLDEDRKFVERKGWDVDVTKIDSSSELMVVINNFKLSDKYIPREISLLVRLLQGYPITPIDSWWTNPVVTLSSNSAKPPGATGENAFLEKTWQWWSRHPSWRAGIDNLETFMAIVIKELQL